jgi:hypothetical protein
MQASIFTLFSPTRKSNWRYLPVWNLAGSYWIQVGFCWILLCRKRTPQIYGSMALTAARSAMRSESGFARRSGERPSSCLRACNCWLIDLRNSMVDPHLRSCRLSTICCRSENFIPHRCDVHRIRQSSQTKIARLAAREPRVWPLVQFFQIRQRIHDQLMRVALSGRAERVDISNNLLSGLRNPGGIQFAGQPVGVQRPINYFVHAKNSELLHRNGCSATSPFDMVKPNFWQGHANEFGFRTPGPLGGSVVTARLRISASRSEPRASTLPSKKHRPAQRSLASRRARLDQLASACRSGVSRWL